MRSVTDAICDYTKHPAKLMRPIDSAAVHHNQTSNVCFQTPFEYRPPSPDHP